MSSNQYLIDATTRHSVFLQRYAGGEAKKAVKTLNRIRREINARLSQEPTLFQRNRLLAVLEDIDSIYTSGYATIEQDVIRGVFALAEQEAGFSTKLYNIATEANFVLPSESSLMQAVELAPMAVPKDVGLTIDAALTEYGDKKIEQIKQAITDGVVLGDTTPEISAKVGNIMTTLHRRQLETLVRTTTNHTSSVARQETFKQNEDILEGYRWIATLDNRTALICMSRDQQKLRIGIDPMPPAHWGCRSTTIPIVKDE